MEQVTFELAKTAKEKGFNEKVLSHYDIEDNLFDNDVLLWTANLEQGIDLDQFYLDCNNMSSDEIREDIVLISAPTYHQLIDWIFDLKEFTNRNIKEGEIVEESILFSKYNEWLEFWYNLLKDCPLAYEFKGRLLEWFRINGYILQIMYGDRSYYWYIDLPKTNSEKESQHTFRGNYEESEHQGILEIFKQFKNAN